MRTKYGNRKVETPDGTFDSRKEYRRWQELQLLERAGAISDLRRQVKYELLPKQYFDGAFAERSVSYIADFVYQMAGKTVVEDVKGYRNPSSSGYAVFVLKRKMMLHQYGIRILEV